MDPKGRADVADARDAVVARPPGLARGAAVTAVRYRLVPPCARGAPRRRVLPFARRFGTYTVGDIAARPTAQLERTPLQRQVAETPLLGECAVHELCGQPSLPVAVARACTPYCRRRARTASAPSRPRLTRCARLRPLSATVRSAVPGGVGLRSQVEGPEGMKRLTRCGT